MCNWPPLFYNIYSALSFRFIWFRSFDILSIHSFTCSFFLLYRRHAFIVFFIIFVGLLCDVIYFIRGVFACILCEYRSHIVFQLIFRKSEMWVSEYVSVFIQWTSSSAFYWVLKTRFIRYSFSPFCWQWRILCAMTLFVVCTADAYV